MHVHMRTVLFKASHMPQVCSYIR